MFKKNEIGNKEKEESLVPSGTLRDLSIADIKPSNNNPRQLFDKEPLADLLNSISEHGVLVPITVYKIKGQDKYSILDGERRYRCCEELEKSGKSIKIPANIVDPPSKVAGLLYMFSIHNLREQWELMPTALSLASIITDLGTTDSKKLSRLTGLSEPQIERCKILLEFPKEFQDLSLELDPQIRIPANFWIEAYPVLNLYRDKAKEIYEQLGRNQITRILVHKYENKKIKSVIHFRRIMEGYDLCRSDEEKRRFIKKLEEFIIDPTLEIREIFDEFVKDNKRIQNAVNACDDFVTRLEKSKLSFALEKKDLINALENVRDYIDNLLQKLAGEDAPPFSSKKDDLDEEGK